MPSATQLKLWRQQAADKISRLLTENDGTELVTGDFKVDELLRILNNLPKRPANRPPYAGTFPNLAIPEARRKAADLLKQRIRAITGETLQTQDGLVDDTLRVLLRANDRPDGKSPYAEFFPEEKIPPVSVDNLLDIAPYAEPAQVRLLYPHLLVTMATYKINTPLRQAHFLAQVAHESGSFNYLEELASGEDYEGREDLGNVQEGDGVRFKGRGLIQVTGRHNYRHCGTDLGIDLLANPTRLADPDLACLSAGWFWNREHLNSLADEDDLDNVTLTINGGYNGYEERRDFLIVAKQVLQV
ncbi:glycoside hydrolase family 19 protein [Alkalinema sp. FACHB-956]|uniref:glycoside hydrolase family 19 protein n=1 Tax=Alkalinema sp. FACHB-956 TaxID=2692768 RepID=UPI0016847643|nr:glycoside hydrolase family 19 protein [Alkalinema sp. FACHB-956]MBD2327785.1 glycoside hydrolase family 19 protein [Alkalinema sp. FACHB-956]